MDSKVLIIQTAFIGDVILTLPLVQVIKKELNAEIDFMCIPETSQILKNNPYITDLIIYDKRGKDKNLKSLSRLSRRVKYKRYDYVISPHRSTRSTYLAYKSKSEVTISFDKSSLSFLYKNRVNYIKNIHEIQRNLKLLEPLNIYSSEIIRPELFWNSDDEKVVELLLRTNNVNIESPFIAVSPGSIWNTKRFPEGKFIDLFNSLADYSFPIVLLGSKRDFELCEFIKDNTQNKNVVITANKLSLLQSVCLISKAKLLVSNDSAPLHIGNAVGTKVFAIFGATTPDFGFFPYNEGDKIYEIDGLNCRPCCIHGSEECPKQHFKCMMNQDENIIASDILKELKLI